MQNLFPVFEAIVVGITSIAIWEFGRLLYHLRLIEWQRTKAWRALFKRESIAVFLSSEKDVAEHPNVTAVVTKPRESDRNIENQIRHALNNYDKGQTKVDFDNPASHILVIGSVRYNDTATRVQQYFDLPFQFVIDDVFETELATKRLKIVSTYGDEYSSSVDLKPMRDETVDYGMLFIALLPNNKRLCWISGIHGLGTLGVAKYFLKNNATLLTHLPETEFSGVSWLFRIRGEYPGNEDLEDVHSFEKISEPHYCERRKSASPSQHAIICDLGNVLMSFDPSLAFRAIGHLTHQDHQKLSADFECSKLKERYEKGELSDTDFYNHFCSTLGLPAALTYNLFKEFWGDIFSPNQKVVQALKSLKKNQNTKLVLASETNGLHFKYVNDHYTEIITLFDNRLVLSYKERLLKTDPEFYQRVISKIGQGINIGDCVYIDDQPRFVQAAKNKGMHGIIFQSYAQFVFQMRTLGFYIS